MRVRQLTIPAELSSRRVFADPGALVVAVLFYFTVTVVLSALWRIGADTTGGEVVGYSAVALTWYIATSEACICSLDIRMIETIGDEIGSGAVAVEMLRPFRVVAVRLAVETGRALARVAVLVVAGVGLCLVVVGRPPDGGALALAAPALAIAITCNVALQHAVAAASFWIRDTRSSWFIYQKLIFILGGMLIPLEVLPATLQSVAMKLPFMAMAYVPARLASGHFEPGLIAIQIGWLIVLVAAAVAVFAAGEKRLQVVGG